MCVDGYNLEIDNSESLKVHPITFIFYVRLSSDNVC